MRTDSALDIMRDERLRKSVINHDIIQARATAERKAQEDIRQRKTYSDYSDPTPSMVMLMTLL